MVSSIRSGKTLVSDLFREKQGRGGYKGFNVVCKVQTIFDEKLEHVNVGLTT
jgi:hypothetical protein